jgi:recombination protein RecA
MTNKEIEKLKKDINKKYGQGTITTASKALAVNVKRIPTGSFALDCETGGGYPKGRITIIAGMPSTGKSFLAYKAVAEAQKMYPNTDPWWIDQEGSFEGEWASKFGIDLDRLEVVRPATAEQALDIATVLIGRTDIPLIVIDSLAAMSPKGEIEGSMEDFTMGLAARQNNKFFRKAQAMLNIGNLEEEIEKPAVIIINQLRKTMDKYNPETMPGGMGQEFASSLTILVRTGDRYVEKKDDGTEVYVGHQVKFKTEKNKTFAPKRTGVFDIYVGEANNGFVAGEIDRLKEIITYAVRWDVIKRGGSWYTILGDENMKFQGGDKVLEFLRDNDDVREEVANKVLAIATGSLKIDPNEPTTIVTEDGKEIDPETGEVLKDGE